MAGIATAHNVQLVMKPKTHKYLPVNEQSMKMENKIREHNRIHHQKSTTFFFDEFSEN